MSLSVKTPLKFLDCTHAWEQLTPEEQVYIHHLNKANWASFPISIKQCSVEAYDIFVAFLKMYKNISHVELLKKSEVSDSAKEQYEDYVSTFFANGGNYLSFGDKKFIPECSKEEFTTIINASGHNYFESLIDIIYDVTPCLIHFGIPPEGCTAYYSSNITKEDIEHCNALLQKKGMLLENTRIDKINNKLVIGIASIEEREEEYEDVILKYGWCHSELEMLVNELKECEKLELVQKDKNKKEMFKNYIQTFTNNYNLHKEAQRWWVRDQKPSVEFNVGFIETYEDPIGVRGEWEMFVAVVDKEKTKELTELVQRANEILPSLPWGKVFEKDVFESPDFTSIDIVGFGTSGLPIGINLPNYDDVRMEQFKNVSLSNVMACGSSQDNIPFISLEQQTLYKTCSPRALETQVALHELLGHGSGKYLRCDNGKKNFPENLTNPLTGEKVKYYQDKMTYDTVFKSLGSAMEECRAEAVGLFLTYNPIVKEILNLSEDVQYINWLSEMRSGLTGLKFYNPETKSWGQAHCQARFALFKAVEKSGAVEVVGENIVLHRELIPKGIEALKELLLKIQVCRATADTEYAHSFFIPLSTPNEDELKFREIVINKKIPRSGFIQCNTKMVDGKVSLITYKSDIEGMIQSFLDRYSF
ncbi:dipeptidyl-peptidase III, putative [Entamoeba histolytica HM-1:IMSS-B]|uniref:Dipeptidyl peptidase 3 n=6 Tax=Entamoeba histolytica TaxID=5759 RepID=C4LUC2_ENTH1|nr:dipeptidyl-peptidase III, putative [Entamoeba histolytica HM-1:IMSS]EMD42366.1 dipeptidyl peptidase III, putative [Entamoeba histolytica KU27]EMH76115.1 dipeptidyl-peptidase III, putative [Entamoeba histolytica HM-1:IMSS-B]EMS11065.1 dipeptidyl peptidase III, putative [Entamoeba histolytica HM-3:IMSS]ENY64351.1 dipeptidyl peptidase III, putative [Entamoeba histolytica HM-1:IMSS-A]GAT92204.1 dipeptidyl-peptidase III putative [Entamoeba histolytica]|eukprot:XP_654273.1 dipeptidyl-peptidase III, putative [Entamoeba histolytica HM-1:IMSS]